MTDVSAPQPAQADSVIPIVNDVLPDASPDAARVAPEPVPAPMVASAPRVVLVGMPGSGKSTIGRRVASALNLPIVDSDLLIEQARGKACGDVFAELGEAKFRELEEEYVARALATGGVVSLGGGAVLSEATRQLLQRHTVVWIDVTAEEGIRRTAEDSTRPVLNAQGDGDREERYRELFEQREPLYREVATFRVRTDDRPPQRVVAEILGFIDPQ